MQARAQQAGMSVVRVVVAVPVVRVTVEVELHWYWDSRQGEEHREPMAQQPPREVSVAFIMQLGGGVSWWLRGLRAKGGVRRMG